MSGRLQQVGRRFEGRATVCSLPGLVPGDGRICKEGKFDLMTMENETEIFPCHVVSRNDVPGTEEIRGGDY